MIWLYDFENENYASNGNVALLPDVCEIDTNSWELTLSHPIDDDGRWKHIVEGAVLKVPSFLKDDQLFRIFKKSKSDSGVEATANPIFFDSSMDTMLIDVRPTDKNGQQALDILTQNTRYTGSSDIKNISTAYYQYKNLMEALTSDDDNSFINRWGGEILYDNFRVVINEEIGVDNGVKLLYGKNIQLDGLREEISEENVVTRIYPKAYNGYTLSENGYVDSPLAENYRPSVRSKVIEFSDVKMRADAQENDEANGVIVCDSQQELDQVLIQKCNEQFEMGIDKPEISIEADMILLENTTEYENYKSLEKVSLGDVIYCCHNKLDIETKARVASLIYDCIRKKVSSVIIGTKPYDYFSETSSIINAADKVIDTSNNTLMADRIAGVLNLLNTSLRAQKDIAQKQDVRAILFEDLDKSSPTFGALCIGTQGIQIAKKRNETDTDWQWGTAIDFQSINADYMITGILTDKNGKFYLNLDTGELRMKDGSFVGNITGGTINIGSNFFVDSNGNMTAKNATFQGNITGGNISGVNINGAQIKLTRDRYVTVYSTDPTKISNYLMESGTLTDAEKQRLDFNNDGEISTIDYIIAEQILNGKVNNHFIDEILINYDKSEIICRTKHSNGQLSNQWETQIKDGGIVTGSIIAGKRYSDHDASIGFNGDWLITYGCGISVGGSNSGGLSNLQLYTGSGDYSANGYIFNPLYGYIALGTGDGLIDTFGGRLYIEPKDHSTYDMFVRPRTNGKSTLGDTSHRFYGVYLTHSPNVSSDRRMKEDFCEFDERYIKLFEKIKPTIYKLKSASSKKSKLSGFIAQDVLEAMKECGIEKKEFGIVKYDEESDSYALIYDMFIPLLFYYIQSKQKEFDEYKQTVEERLKRLEEKINADNN